MKNIMITILAMLLIGTCGYIVYDKVVSNNTDKTVDTKEYNVKEEVKNSNLISYDTIKGVYEYITDANIEEMPGAQATYRLVLWDDGTFTYQHYVDIPSSEVGNYMIVDNELILNPLFETNSGAGIYAISNKKNISIKSDSELVDAKNPLTHISVSEVTLTKTKDDVNSYTRDSLVNVLKNSIIEK